MLVQSLFMTLRRIISPSNLRQVRWKPRATNDKELAQYFSIEYHKNYKVLWNGLANETYVLTMCNTPAPPASNFKGTVTQFTIPIQHAGSSSRSAVSFLERLGVRQSLKYVATTSIMSSPCTLAMVDSKQLVGFPATGRPADITVNFARGPGPAQVNASVQDITATVLIHCKK